MKKYLMDDDDECAACQTMQPVEGGEDIVTYTHRIEGRAVAQDWEWICAKCVKEREMAEWP